MASQHTRSQSLKAVTASALCGIGLFMLSWSLDGAATQLATLLGATQRHELRMLLSALCTAWQALRPGEHRLLGCLLQTLGSLWPLLLVIVVAQ